MCVKFGVIFAAGATADPAGYQYRCLNWMQQCHTMLVFPPDTKPSMDPRSDAVLMLDSKLECEPPLAYD